MIVRIMRVIRIFIFFWLETDCAFKANSDSMCDMQQGDTCAQIPCSMAEAYPGSN